MGKSDHKVINRISFSILISRMVLAVLLLSFLWIGGFSSREFWAIIYLIGPVTVVYFSAFIRFMLRYPYTIENLKLGKLSSSIGQLLPVILGIGYLTLITINALYKTIVPFDIMQNLLFIGELINAIYIATYLAFLFEIRDKKE